jgi:hypothetical protein
MYGLKPVPFKRVLKQILKAVQDGIAEHFQPSLRD